MSATAPGIPIKQPYPSSGYAWYVVVLLTAAYVVSFIDRQIMALLVEPIKASLELSDTQMGLLLGVAFALFYVLLGVPIGWLADRRSRRAIVGVGITLWCLMTAACGLAKNFGWLFFARLGVGVGEATLSPAAYSLISDYFPREKRSRAISFFMMGISVGSGVAYVVGGQVVELVAKAPPLVLPVIGTLYAWQTAFLAVGLPGLVIAALMFTVKEPARRGLLRQDAPVDSGHVTIRDAARYLFERRRAYGSLGLGMSVVTTMGYAWFWLPSLFARVYGWTIGEFSLRYGIVLLIFGPLGVTVGGFFSDWLYQRGVTEGPYRATVIAVAILIVAAVAIPLMPDGWWALALLIPATIFGAMASATGGSALVFIAPNELRAQVSALYFALISIVGLTVGPSSVAFFTDQVFADEALINYSLAIVPAVFGTVSLVIFLTGQSHYRECVLEAEKLQ
jgi:MFS family permease